ncbi:MAG: UDP-N-acetylmuramoyl-tripeptide--D-alanyl-D-alanine ligase, partial [Endomicrobiia bacterium]
KFILTIEKLQKIFFLIKMEKVTLRDLVKATQGKFIFGDPKQIINSTSTDSRKIKKGDIFFALKGKNYDGHQFIKKAIEKGATGIVVTKLDDEINSFFPNLPAIILVRDTLKALGDFAGYYRRLFSTKMICVTGSNGKTTTKEMIFSILKSVGKTLANFGSYNNFVGVPITLFDLSSEYEYCVLELGISLKGEMERLIEIAKPEIGVITNIGKTHLEFLKDKQQVFEEKFKLIDSLPEDGIAILNKDDPMLSNAISKVKCKTVTFGLNPESDIYAKKIDLTEKGINFEICFSNKEYINLNLSTIGMFNLEYALAASAVCYSIGIKPDIIKQSLENFKSPSMRMEKVENSLGAIIINDAYNANPDSMRQSILSFLRTYKDKKKILVIGDMLELGEYSQEEHISLGEFLKELSVDRIYFFGKEVSAIKDKVQIKNSNFFNNYIDIIAKLKTELNEDYAVLFKGSRAVGLEKIIEGLNNFK